MRRTLVRPELEHRKLVKIANYFYLIEKMCSSNTLITDFFKELANDDEEETFAKKSKKDDGFGDEEMITIDEDEP